MSSLFLHAAASQQTALSPRLQRAVRLLQMSSVEFAQTVQDALDTNPFLEQDETDVPPITVAADARADESRAHEWSGLPPRTARADDDGAVFDTLQAPDTLAAHLLAQLNVLSLSPRDRELAAAVVESLDDDGYLRVPLGEVADGLALDTPPEPDELLIALRRVQALDPAGVGARDLAECLQLQLPAIADDQRRALASRILAGHLRTLASRDLRMLARSLGCEMAAVDDACTAIRRLDPHPGWRHAAPDVPYVTPDVIVERRRGRWVAALNGDVVPRVKLNRSYVDLFQQFRGDGHAQLGAHLQEARWTVRNVEQRFSTIVSVAQAILDRQQHFLAYGAMAMKPLALRDVAAAVGVHESTVSRVTNNKYIATPSGMYELKFFFSRGLATAGGGDCSPTAVRGVIQEMIAQEPAGQPMSDVEIARALAQQGLQVARRTVTKYRQALRIPPAERRLSARVVP